MRSPATIFLGAVSGLAAIGAAGFASDAASVPFIADPMHFATNCLLSIICAGFALLFTFAFIKIA